MIHAVQMVASEKVGNAGDVFSLLSIPPDGFSVTGLAQSGNNTILQLSLSEGNRHLSSAFLRLRRNDSEKNRSC